MAALALCTNSDEEAPATACSTVDHAAGGSRRHIAPRSSAIATAAATRSDGGSPGTTSRLKKAPACTRASSSPATMATLPPWRKKSCTARARAPASPYTRWKSDAETSATGSPAGAPTKAVIEVATSEIVEVQARPV
jgi:hypothetical protein